MIKFVIIKTKGKAAMAINDAALSFKARGIHSYLMNFSKEDRNLDSLIFQTSEPAKSVLEGMIELCNHGYCKRVAIQEEDGTHSKTIFFVFDRKIPQNISREIILRHMKSQR